MTLDIVPVDLPSVSRSGPTQLHGVPAAELQCGRCAGACCRICSPVASPGATGFGLEELKVRARPDGKGSGGDAFVASLTLDDAGLVRSPDLELMGLRATNTAAVTTTGSWIAPGAPLPDALAGARGNCARRSSDAGQTA